MKQLFLTITVLGLLQIATPGQAQVSVQVNVGVQPQWGPVGYDYAAYYYLPDIDVYYNVPRRQFVYLNGGRWIFAAALPDCYRGYDLYRGYKVVLNDNAPYRRCDYYRGQYGRYKGNYGRQVVIRDDRRRYERYDHYDRYDHDDHHDNGKHKGNGKSKHHH
ncbi:hypothetical protein [Flavihumibacter fluvii]|uniref:hypothetical protein n=1 Tax=Flavihumibacter fluvii TaxID=2838157 RepID=UPI001BDE4624|nr:hypothetical protein [Flavihumibacter fluvii]ULQ52072.1 hypothetical protein KJS93_18425 [Flavihumibacter fluvii]